MNDFLILDNPSKLTPELARAGCFVIGMSNEDYHSYEGISNSGLSLIDESPAAYKYREPFKFSQAMKEGSAIHTLYLEPNEFDERYIILTGLKDRRKNEFQQAKKQHGEEFVLIDSELTKIQKSVASIKNSTDPDIKAANKRTDGNAEISAFVECPVTGVLLRCRYDMLYFSDDLCHDLKKTRDITQYGFSKSITDYRYHVQHYMYAHVYKLITGRTLKFRFLCVQDSSPYSSCLYDLDEVALMVAEYYYNKNLSTYAECIKKDNWPHPNIGGEISITNWAVTQYQEEIIGEQHD